MRSINNALRRLDYVFAAVDHGSLRQAARSLRIRESSLSRNIVALEQFLDMQLFDRTAQGVRLTLAGEAWVAATRVHYERMNAALAGNSPRPHDLKTLRVALSSPGGRRFLLALLRRYRELYPDVDVIIQDLPLERALAAVRRRQIDIAFTGGHAAARACSSEIFDQERLFVLVPMEHPLAKRAAVSWADLANERMFLPASFCDGVEFDCAVADDPGSDAAIQTVDGSEATILLKVQLGQGVTLAQESVARSVAADFTTWRPMQGHNSLSACQAVWLDSNPKRALLRLLSMARKLASSRPEEHSRPPDDQTTAGAIAPVPVNRP